MLNANVIAQSIPIGQLRESPTNPRRTFSEEGLRDLAASIRALGGLVQPILVRPLDGATYEVVAGARRFRAARLAGLDALDARVVRLTDEQAVEVQLVENCQRADVHPYEEAAAYCALLVLPHYDVASIASKVGKSVSYIHGRLRLAELIPEAAEVFLADQITAGHALIIARLPQAQQKEALEAAFREDWRTKEKQVIPVRELSQWIRENLMLTLRDAVFDLESAELYPEAGACTACQMRTGANAALFEDVAEDDRCLSPGCHATKVENHITLLKQQDGGLIQITRAHYTNSKDGEPILTRSEYTILEEAGHAASADQPAPAVCDRATRAIVVEGPGKRGEVVQVCADPECAVHGKPNHRADQEETNRQREERMEAETGATAEDRREEPATV